MESAGEEVWLTCDCVLRVCALGQDGDVMDDEEEEEEIIGGLLVQVCRNKASGRFRSIVCTLGRVAVAASSHGAKKMAVSNLCGHAKQATNTSKGTRRRGNGSGGEERTVYHVLQWRIRHPAGWLP